MIIDLLGAFILQPDEPSSGYRKNWERLIQKIYEADPLACPRCKGEMRIIAFIEKQEVIKKILQRRTSPQTPGIMGSETPTPSPEASSYPLPIPFPPMPFLRVHHVYLKERAKTRPPTTVQ